MNKAERQAEATLEPPAAGRPVASPSRRNAAIDVARGIAIVAVVLSHTMRGAQADGEIAATAAYRLADAGLYLFHVQLFLLISGYLAFPRADQLLAQRNRQLSLGYTYLLWSVISLTALIVTTATMRADNLPRLYLSLLYAPIQHFWFLPTVMIGFALLYGLRTPLALGLAFALCLCFRLVAGFSYYALDYYLAFYLIGAWLRCRPISIAHPGWLTLASAIVFSVGLGTIWTLGLQRVTIPAMIPVSLAGCYVAYRLAQAILRWPRVARCLEIAGQGSLPIFLAHVIFTAGSRRGIMALDANVVPELILGVSLIAGLLGPLLLDRIAARLNLQRLAGFEPILR